MTLAHLVVLLAAVCIAVPLFRKLGFGSVLGYLAAGILIGPYGLALIGNVEVLLHVSEFGVVLLLFIIGLELQPSRLWVMRRAVFGLGAAQVLVTAALIGLAARAFGLGNAQAALVGLALALSSTAFVLQILAEKGHLAHRYGRASFSILLFQDLAVIPILALIPALSASGVTGDGALVQGLIGVAAVAGLVLGGHYLLRPAFRVVAALGGHDIFTAAALLVVVGAAWLMHAVGVSMALGAFLAGMLLADSEFRHQLEAEIEPFKGLLLGLFFVAVGMAADLSLIADSPLLVLALTAGLVAVKMTALWLVARASGMPGDVARDLAFVLPQGGEFAFVIFTAAVAEAAMSPSLAGLLTVVVTLSMAVTPLLFILNERAFRDRAPSRPRREYDTVDDHSHRVIIAGMGRFGQIIARVLNARGIPFTAIEASARQVDFVRRFRNKVYYGDVTDPDLLRAARVDQAEVFVVAVQGVENSLKVVECMRKLYPKLKIYARAWDRHHAHLLKEAGVDYLIREALLSSLEMAAVLLEELGDKHERARRTIEIFRENDDKLFRQEHAVMHDEHEVIQTIEASRKELEALFDSDRPVESG